MKIDTVRVEEARVFDSAAGYHQFFNDDGYPYGSYEVFWTDGDDDLSPGWYWRAGFPGGLPDSEPNGPVARSSRAKDDALDGN